MTCSTEWATATPLSQSKNQMWTSYTNLDEPSRIFLCVPHFKCIHMLFLRSSLFYGQWEAVRKQRCRETVIIHLFIFVFQYQFPGQQRAIIFWDVWLYLTCKWWTSCHSNKPTNPQYHDLEWILGHRCLCQLPGSVSELDLIMWQK